MANPLQRQAQELENLRRLMGQPSSNQGRDRTSGAGFVGNRSPGSRQVAFQRQEAAARAQERFNEVNMSRYRGGHRKAPQKRIDKRPEHIKTKYPELPKYQGTNSGLISLFNTLRGNK